MRRRPGNARARVASRLDARNGFLQRAALPRGPRQQPVQSLACVRQREAALPQPIKHGHIQRQARLCGKQRQAGGRNRPGDVLPRRQRPANRRSRTKARQRPIVIIPDAADGERLHGGVSQTAHILHCQGQIGGVEGLRGHAKIFRHRLAPGADVAHARLQAAAYFPGKRLRLVFAQFCKRLQQRHIVRFTAERKRVATQTRQHAYAAAGEKIRRAYRKQRRQFKHRVRAAQKRHTRARPLGKHRRLAALGEVSRQADNHAVATCRAPRRLQVIEMAVVKGIVFGDHAGNGHGTHLLLLL